MTGAPDTVFDWASARCAHLGHPRHAGPRLARRGRRRAAPRRLGGEPGEPRAGASARLARDCAVLYRGARRDDPADYDDRAWVHATFAGRAGDWRSRMWSTTATCARRCRAGGYAECWRNAIVELRSDDGGRSFRRAGPGGGAALSLFRRGRRPQRLLQPEQHPAARRASLCLRHGRGASARSAAGRACCAGRSTAARRTGAPGTATGFGVRFADPYREDVADPERHVCAPVDGLASTVSSVVRHGPSGRYLAVTATTRTGPDGIARSGVYWTRSTDLVRWSEPALLWEAPLLWRRDCDARRGLRLSVADRRRRARRRTSRRVGEHFWLYLVEMPLGPGCRVGPERDLIRMPVSWPAP